MQNNFQHLSKQLTSWVCEWNNGVNFIKGDLNSTQRQTKYAEYSKSISNRKMHWIAGVQACVPMKFISGDEKETSKLAKTPKMFYEVFLQHVSLHLVVSCFIPTYTRCPLGNCKEKCFLHRTSDQGQKQHAEQPNSRTTNIKYSFLILRRFFSSFPTSSFCRHFSAAWAWNQIEIRWHRMLCAKLSHVWSQVNLRHKLCNLFSTGISLEPSFNWNFHF